MSDDWVVGLGSTHGSIGLCTPAANEKMGSIGAADDAVEHSHGV